MPPWALAFATAGALTLAAVPLLRRLALATDFVDHPGQHKSHEAPTPYLGGVAVIGGVLVASLFELRLAPGAASLILVAAVLGTIGLVDDDRTVDFRWRVLAEVAAATLAVVIGVRVHITGVTGLDMGLTVVWIVGVTNSLNLLDNMDGLAGGVGATAGSAVFFLAIFGRQPGVATLAAALVGACLGFIVYNRPPASIFMGDTGSLFVGFVLAILTIVVTPAVTPPFSFAIPLMLLALPVLDTTMVTLSRLRRGRRVSLGGRDHLSHRLVATGMSRARAVGVLVATEVLLGTLAVLGGRRVVPLWSTVLIAAALLAVLMAATLPAVVYTERVVGLPRRVRLALVIAIVTPSVLAVPALVALAAATGPAREATTLTEGALEAMAAGDGPAAAAGFRRAEQLFAEADHRLHYPLTSIGSIVPGLSANLATSRTLVAIGRDLSRTGGALAVAADGGGLEVRGGSVSLDTVKGLAPVLTRAAQALQTARERLTDIQSAFLFPPLTRATDGLQQRVDGQASAVGHSAELAGMLPDLLGDARPRHYFVAFEDNAQPQGTGGLITNWTELIAENGRLRVDRFGGLSDLDAMANGIPPPAPDPPGIPPGNESPQPWHQVNLSPDFPTAAEAITGLYQRAGGGPLDGVIAVDRAGLAALLDLAGPVSVDGLAEPVSATNLIDMLEGHTAGAVATADDTARVAAQVTRRAAERFVAADLGAPAKLARVLGEAGRDGHLLVHLTNPAEENLVRGWGADGAVPPVQGDSLLVTDQSLGDTRVAPSGGLRLRYDVRLVPGRKTTSLLGSLSVDLPKGAAAPLSSPQAGSYLSVYSPFAMRSSAIDGRQAELGSQTALGRQVHSRVVGTPEEPGQSVRLDLDGRVVLSPDGWYRLDLLHQPALVPNDVEVAIDVPRGWRIAETRGVQLSGRDNRGQLRLSRDHTVWVRVERTGWALVWDRLWAR